MNKSRVLVVEDDAVLREALIDTLLSAGYPVSVAENGSGAVDLLEKQAVDMVVSDVQMPKMDGHGLLEYMSEHHPQIPVLLMTAYGTIQAAVQAMKAGAVDYLVKPFDADTLVNLVEKHVQPSCPKDDSIVAQSPSFKELLSLSARVANSTANVLIQGESGTGKEEVAKYIHRHSDRAFEPFIAVNCAAIPENMLEAMLFGHEKGAFTGAIKALPGKFEQAQGGTLLLDEVSEMALPLQAKLLRVIQERELERLGSQKTIHLDVRILATTNRSLREEVAKGRFREDLYYRLNVFPLTIPPLRDRKEDILPLAERFLQKYKLADEGATTFDDSARVRLVQHAWGGNVRELENIIQRALILKTRNVITGLDLSFESMGLAAEPTAQLSESDSSLTGKLKTQEEQIILDVLAAVNGNRKAAAERLGVSQRTLRYKLAKLREMGCEVI